MKDLITQLKSLEGEGKRTAISIIRELNENIIEAQKIGYKVEAIHEEISQKVDVDLASFKTLLYRVRKKDGSKATPSKQDSAILKPDVTPVTTNAAAGRSAPKDLKDVTERSKNKLASFGKGKKT